MFCEKMLTLVTVGTVNNEIVNKHPMMVRIEQQVKNHEELTYEPKIDDVIFTLYQFDNEEIRIIQEI